MNNFRVKPVNLVALAVLLLLILSIFVFSDNIALAWTTDNESREERIYWRGTIDEAFDGTSVLVVMDKRVGGINKQHSRSFFGEFPIEEVRDLTYLSNELIRNENGELEAPNRYLDFDNLNQILQIKLPTDCKENVVHVIRQIEQIDGVLSAEPNYYGTPFAQPPNATGIGYPQQWGLHHINHGIRAEQAWDITTGSSAVRVGVMDSGLNNHLDFNANIANVGGDFFNRTTPGPLRDDVVGHGTLVAGIIGATGNQTNGIAGVAWNVRLVPMQISTINHVRNPWYPTDPSREGIWHDVAAATNAINWAGTNNIPILNLSAGWPTESQALRSAITAYTGLLVVAAGNLSGMNSLTQSFPAVYANQSNSNYSQFSNRIISVGASTQTGDAWSDSVRDANHVSIFAPGVNILSTFRNNGYLSNNGTSFAAPYVAGIAALMLSLNSNLQSSEIKNIILENATKPSALNGLCSSNGRVDALKAVQIAALTTSINNMPSGKIAITGVKTGVNLSSQLIIPERLQGREVTTIGNEAFRNQKNINNVVFPSTITELGERAFQFCYNMMKVDMSAATELKNIKKYAFDSCRLSSGIVYPPNLQIIGEGAFIRTQSPTETIPSSVTEIEDYAYSFTPSNDPNYPFPNPVKRTMVVLSRNLQVMGKYAFSHYDNPILFGYHGSSWTTIDDYAFFRTEVAFITNSSRTQLPVSITSIGMGAFQNSNIPDITLPQTVTAIGAGAFNNNPNLTIYSERASRPADWNSNWNGSNRPVVWGCTLSADKSYVVSFTKTASNPQNIGASGGMTAPFRDSFNFGGWATTPGGSSAYSMATLGNAPNNTTLYAIWNTPSSCVAEGTLITLADGSQVPVESLTGNELLLVWNNITGDYDVAPIIFVDSDPYASYEIIHLFFSNGTEVKVIDEHAFFSLDLNRYVYMRSDASQYIGQWFKAYDSNLQWQAVQLTEVQIYNEYTTAWSPVTFKHLNFYVNGMLSMPGAIEGMINIFSIDPLTLSICESEYLQDIATYGLFTYEEFATILPVPEIIYEAFNAQYLKVAIGKGLITIEELAGLIESYARFFTEETTGEDSTNNPNTNHQPPTTNHQGNQNQNEQGGNGKGNGNGNQGNQNKQ